MEPPFRRIADQIAERIAAGELPPGARVPSTRQIVERHGVAMATASKVLAELRHRGLVRAEPGVGTVVVPPARRGHPAPPAPSRTQVRDALISAAIAVADAEGLAAVSMRRLTGETGVPTMSIYRHVAGREELLMMMMDRVFAANPPPDPAPTPRRAALAELCRLQWSMYRRHPWLAHAVSFTRPLLAPHAMAHTEWTMRALDGSRLSGPRLFLTAMTLANYVRGTAVNLEAEAQAEQDTGLSEDQWMQSQQERLAAVLAGGALPLVARAVAEPEADFGLDELMEYGLQRLLDGIEQAAG